METITRAENLKKRIFIVRASNKTSAFLAIFQTKKHDAPTSSSIDIALQKWEPGYGFLRRIPTSQKLLSTHWIENAPLREWETKDCLIVCLVRKLILCRTILQLPPRKLLHTQKDD